MTDEERKIKYAARRKQVLIAKILFAVVLSIVFVLFIFIISAVRSGYHLDPTIAMSVHYDGINGSADAELLVDREELYNCMDKAYAQYTVALWPLVKSYSQKDYHELADSITAELDSDSNLKNEDEISISVSYNEALAKKLNVIIDYELIPMQVGGLKEGTKLTKEDFFKDLTISYNGMSPAVSVNFINNSNNEYIKKLEYKVDGEKQFFENGDTFTVAVSVNQPLAKSMYMDVKEDCFTQEYTVENMKTYVSSVSDFSEEDFKYAVKKGEECFVGANEYGLRIFTEAGLTYTWVGTQDYTFEWSNPRLISAYVETIKDEYLGDFTKKYNYLELVYMIHIEQANGTGCDAEAVVCFDSLTKNADGSINLNEESGQLFSASYIDKNIKSSLAGWFGDDYNLEKFDLSEMNI